jgi:choline dehydrogenase
MSGAAATDRSVTRCKAAHPLFETFLRGGEQAGFPITPDHNGYQQEGMHTAQAFIDKGVRQSASRAYLRPAAHRSNLTVLTKTMVTQVVVRNGAAEGIEVQERGTTRVIPCHREVILCAGAMGTPQLLMLSGVGPAEELNRHGLKITAEAPEVGRNLQNHPGVDLRFATAFKDSLTAELTVPKRALIGAEWMFLRKGLGASNFFEAGAFLRTRDDVDFPNMQYEFLPLTRRLIDNKLVPIPGFQVWMDLSRPMSRGTVTLRSANPAGDDLQPPPGAAGPAGSHRRNPADARPLAPPAGLGEVQGRRAQPRTGRDQRQPARGVRPDPHRHVVSRLRELPDGRRR